MLSLFSSRLFGRNLDEVPAALAAAASHALTQITDENDEIDSTLFRTMGWITAGLGAVAFGLFVGRELRQRYKFNRRTPYDFYAQSGDERHDVEFGVGI